MALYITSLNSGSNGNCYYVGNEREAVLIDAGLSCRQIEVRMQRLGLSLQSVKAVFVSHEHCDHISGIPILAYKYQLPVYITAPTLRNARFAKRNFSIRLLRADEPVWVNDLCVTAFPKAHDAADPHSFLIQDQGINVGVFTDIGTVCEQVIQHFRQCHAAFLETNYDDDMLEYGRYPYVLKQRIRGGRGHLSNRQALDLFRTYRAPFLSHVLLSHLSQHNNSPQVVQDLFAPHVATTELIVASRMTETPVYRIEPNRLIHSSTDPISACSAL